MLTLLMITLIKDMVVAWGVILTPKHNRGCRNNFHPEVAKADFHHNVAKSDNFRSKVTKTDGEKLWKPELRWKTGKLEMEEKEAIVSQLYFYLFSYVWMASSIFYTTLGESDFSHFQALLDHAHC